MTFIALFKFMISFFRKKYFLVLLFFLAIIFFSYPFYFSKVKFFKPILVELKGTNYNDLKSINAWSIGPLGTKFVLEKKQDALCFVGDYAFRNDIILHSNSDVFNKITEIKFDDGDQINTIVVKNISKQENHGRLPEEINVANFSKGNSPSFLMVFSVFFWKGWIRVVFFILFLFFIFSTGYLYFKINKRHFIQISVKIKKLVFFYLPATIANPKIRSYLLLFMIVTYSLVFYNLAQFSNGAKFVMNDNEYHSAGVNFAKGYGISRIGAIEPFSSYKFTEYGPNLEFNYKFFTRLAGSYQFQNPPGYGLFLGVIYLIGGVNPIVAKYIQLLLLIIVASFLPFLGYSYWKMKGYLSGIIASVIFMNVYYQYAVNLNPQCLLIFMILLDILALDKYFKKPSVLSACILGFIVAFTILVKALVILLPLLIILYLYFKFFQTREKKYVIHILTFTVAFIVPFVPWSIYASERARQSLITREVLDNKLFKIKLNETDNAFLSPIINKDSSLNSKYTIINDAGILMCAEDFAHTVVYFYGNSMSKKHFVLLSTQANEDAFLSVHNEYIQNGGFNVQWILDKKSFYNNDGLMNYSPFLRIINFYYHYPVKIYTLPFTKLYAAFSHYPYLISLGILNLLNFLGFCISKYKKHWVKTVFVFVSAFLFLTPFKWTITQGLFGIVIFLVILVNIMSMKKKNNDDNFEIPKSLSMMVLCLILFTIIEAGDRRFTVIIDFMFILVSTYGFVAFFSKWLCLKQRISEKIKSFEAFFKLAEN